MEHSHVTMDKSMINNPIVENTQETPKLSKSRRYQPCQIDINIDQYFISFLTTNAFFSEINRNVKKVYTKDIDTANVCFDREWDVFVLNINPDFIKTLRPKQIQALLTHEFYHIVFGHLAWKPKPFKLWNIAWDLHINSLIKKSIAIDSTHMELGTDWCVPGVRATHPDGTALTDEELKSYPLVEFIEKLHDDASSVQYFHALIQAGFDKIVKDDIEQFYGFTEIDDHDSFEANESPDDYIMIKSKALAERAVKHADALGSWGNIPQEIRSELRKWISQSIDWRSVLRHWVGYLNRGSKRSTLKKINKRYPYIYPGVQRSQIARLLIAIDQSGSVYDQMIEIFFSEILSLAKNVEIDFIVFDYTVDTSSFLTLKKGNKPELIRTRCGGTNFDAPTKYVNDPENRGKWDGLLILTDGEAPAPGPCNIRRAWVYTDSCKLQFETDETQIVISSDVDKSFIG
jgi:predicted metal-dependent peptidase